MITILEGADGSGKSYLAKAAFGDTYIRHLSAPKGDPLEEIVAQVDGTPRPATFDRLHLSEQVYGPLFRGGPLNWRVVRQLEKWLASQSAVVVFCRPPRAVAKANWAKRVLEGKEMYTESYGEIWEKYASLTTSLPYLNYDYTVEQPHELRARVEWLRKGYLNNQTLEEFLS